jgi:hypothetical protein
MVCDFRECVSRGSRHPRHALARGALSGFSVGSESAFGQRLREEYGKGVNFHETGLNPIADTRVIEAQMSGPKP